jgi:hypothetical protein
MNIWKLDTLYKYVVRMYFLYFLHKHFVFWVRDFVQRQMSSERERRVEDDG